MKGNNNPDLQNNMESFNMKNDFHDVTTFYLEPNCKGESLEVPYMGQNEMY